MIFGHDWYFWFAVIGSVIIKMASAMKISWYRAAVAGFTAVFSAVVFTDAVVDYLGLPPETYEVPVAVLIGLTGEGIIKQIMLFTEDLKLKDISPWLRK